MAGEFATFSINERAQARSRLTANVAGLVLFAVITWGFVVIFPILMHCRFEGDIRATALVVVLEILVVALWGGWVVAILWTGILRRKWFRRHSGAISVSETLLQIGSLQIPRSSIDSINQGWRDLVIKYHHDGKACRVTIPLSWLPQGAAVEIVRIIRQSS